MSSNVNSPRQEYAQRLERHEARAATASKWDERVGTARLTLAALIIAATWWSIERSTSTLGLWVLGSIFVVLVFLHGAVKRAHAGATRAADFYRRGLDRLDDRWAGKGHQGIRFHSDDHLYATDIDLFGEGSLFELLCAARTRMGEEELARWLSRPATIDVIRARQAAVTDLRGRIDLREDLATLGADVKLAGRPQELLQWAETPRPFDSLSYRVLAFGLPALLMAAGGLWALSGVASPFFVILIIEAAVLSRSRNTIERYLNECEQAFEGLQFFSLMLARLEREKFAAPLLRDLHASLYVAGLDPARIVGRLATIASFSNARRSSVAPLIVVPLLYTFQVARAAERWRRQFGGHIRSWLDTVGQIEALVSIAAYSYEHGDDPFPEFSGEVATFAATGLAHPLLPADRCVRNDVEVGDDARLLVISGSNMSGKSTLLRAVGLNVVLAMAGAPVRARALRMSALQVGASICTNDSLRDGQSRFFAEITKIRNLLEAAAREPQPMMFLLDEVLAGTRSSDRLTGATGIVRAFLARGAVGMISTHDLALTQLSEGEPRSIRNVHFQDEIDAAGTMLFDYRLREGVATRSNGVALMRLIGLDV